MLELIVCVFPDSFLIFFLASWMFLAFLIISLFIFIMVSEPTINLFFIFILLALSLILILKFLATLNLPSGTDFTSIVSAYLVLFLLTFILYS